MRRQSQQHVLLFLYRDARSTGAVLAAAARIPGVRRTAAIARSPAGDVRIEASPASGSTTPAADAVTTALDQGSSVQPMARRVHRLRPDHHGLAAFVDLVPLGTPVLLVAVCAPGVVDTVAIAGSVQQLLRVTGEPAERALHIQATVEDQPRRFRSPTSPPDRDCRFGEPVGRGPGGGRATSLRALLRAAARPADSDRRRSVTGGNSSSALVGGRLSRGRTWRALGADGPARLLTTPDPAPG